MPALYIITGSNGAGKSTVGPTYLPLEIQQNYTIFDGDKLFMEKRKELSKTIPSFKEAKKIAFQWLSEKFEFLTDDALARNDSFAYEGHFTNDSTWDIPKRFKKNGYSVYLIFFGLSNPSLSELRVVERAKEEGHYVPPREIESNFFGNLEKLNKYFDLIDELQIVDTSEANHKVLACFVNGEVHSCVPFQELPEWFMTNLPRLILKIRTSQNI